MNNNNNNNDIIEIIQIVANNTQAKSKKLLLKMSEATATCLDLYRTQWAPEMDENEETNLQLGTLPMDVEQWRLP